MLKWTYAYGYYAFEDADRNSEVARHKGFFEFLQVRLGGCRSAWQGVRGRASAAA